MCSLLVPFRDHSCSPSLSKDASLEVGKGAELSTGRPKGYRAAIASTTGFTRPPVNVLADPVERSRQLPHRSWWGIGPVTLVHQVEQA